MSATRPKLHSRPAGRPPCPVAALPPALAELAAWQLQTRVCFANVRRQLTRLENSPAVAAYLAEHSADELHRLLGDADAALMDLIATPGDDGFGEGDTHE